MQNNEDEVTEKLSKVLAQFRYLYHYGRKTYDVHKTNCCNLRHGDAMMLFAIKNEQRKRGGGVTTTELSESMGIKPPSITPVLAVLEKNGLISRSVDPNDRRFVRIILSDEGESQIQQFREEFGARMRGLVAYLGTEKSSQLANLMNDVYCYLQQKNQKQTDKTQK